MVNNWISEVPCVSYPLNGIHDGIQRLEGPYGFPVAQLFWVENNLPLVAPSLSYDCCQVANKYYVVVSFETYTFSLENGTHHGEVTYASCACHLVAGIHPMALSCVSCNHSLVDGSLIWEVPFPAYVCL